MSVPSGSSANVPLTASVPSLLMIDILLTFQRRETAGAGHVECDVRADGDRTGDVNLVVIRSRVTGLRRRRSRR